MTFNNKNNDLVSEWLSHDDDTRSVISSVSRIPASEYGEVFDDSKYVVQEEFEEVAALPQQEVAEVEVALGEVARAVQRKTVSAFHAQYARGRMLDVPVYGTVPQRPQKFFQVASFMEIASVDDTAFMAKIANGVVRTRLGAQTGVGKTMKLPGKIAANCGLRVCQLELDSAMAKDALEYQKNLYQIPGSVRGWSREKKAFLTCMSYDEFRGIILSGNRDRLFQDFDVFYMDEAHEPLASVWAARQYFAEYAKAHNSLIIASATVSTNDDSNMANKQAGVFRTESTPLSLRDAIDSGRMMTEFIRDRTLLLVACDEDVALARAYYIENGIDVFVLDSASTEADRKTIIKALLVETVAVPRVLVATERYGTGYNFPVSFEISTCTRRVFDLTDEHTLVEKEVPLMSKSIAQHKGRLGRGLASGGGGWLLSSVTAPDKELLPSQALEAYLSLVAANIIPRPGLFDRVIKVLPKGIDANVARMILRVGLPPALTVRYLGSDGRFASKYVSAVKLFMQLGEIIKPSKDELPLGYETWIEERVGNYYEGDESKTKVSILVPFKSPVGLKVAMHTISAVSEGYMDLDYWNWINDEEESDDDYTGVRTKVVRKVKPRMPELPEVKIESSVGTMNQPWVYDADPSNAVKRSRRKGMSWDANGEGKQSVLSLMRALEQSTLGVSVAKPVQDAPEYEGKVVYSLPPENRNLPDNPMVPIKSPGGGRVLLVSKEVHKAFMSGEAMTKEQSFDVLATLSAIKGLQRFAKSTVFDNWSPAWLCWFNTFGVLSVVEHWRDEGIQSDAVKLLEYLYERFRVEVIAVASSSNLYKDSLSSFFRSKPSVSKFVNAVKNGRLPVAQTDTFVTKVMEIKESHDKAVLAIEEAGIFAPRLVTKAQRKLPIHDFDRRMPVIDETTVASRKYNYENKVNDNWRR